MNTERPDNDDDAREAGATADAPEVEEPGTADAGTPAETGESPEAAEPEEAAKAEEAEATAEASEASEVPGQDTHTADAKAAEGVDGAPAAGKPGAPEAAETGAVEEIAETPASDDRQADGESAPATPEPAGALPDEAGDLPRHEGDVRDDEDLVRHDGGRPRTPAIIASVAAAVLLIGGGGAWLASNASSGSGGGTTSGAPGGDDTPPPLALDGFSESTAGGGNGIAPGEPNPYGATYRVGGPLPDGPGKAPVYRAQGEVTKEDVARLAKALGVEGAPVAQGEAWKIGGQDGSGPSLQVNRQAPGSWTFTRYAPGTDNCKGTDTCTAPRSGGTPVSEEVAEKAAAPVLKAVGQDDAKRDASQVMGAQRVVNAAPEVGGLPTYGWTTGIDVGSDGEIVGGSGQLKTPVKGDTYPVVGAEKALELMNGQPKHDHRMGIGGCAGPVPLKDRLEQPCEQPSGGASEPDTVTVENAVFGLAAHVVDGRQALVPSWLFEVTAPGAKDPFTVTYPAVEPKYLASPEPSEPSDQPTSAPGPREVKVDGYRAEGSELTVTFTGGVCADYDVKASEKGDEVTVSVTSTPWPDKVCVMIAKQFQETVRLDEPLGDRAVVNSDGKAVPLAKEGARLPAPPTRER
ncbi:hypothetical protein SAMN06272771_2097 [Streptomyces sp. Ag82_O1-12]|uniref:hypothetical protein n=1 Tax=unclassified Streptomyces TaxID=2593676 RepID=UPI000BDD7978|nr:MULTISPECIES: hypothetical protein [unclassified Streptomyces]SMQ15759.1 hypothetical protein SAMN06272771_2097 [Streptomyces sp. Ag82_O1-12]SOD44787.1 hypothetical protein SAMN06272727_2090 [Streptomyces sp. Ag82_G6-1]